MKNPTIRNVVLHGAYKDKYGEGCEVAADSMFTLCSLVFKEIYPELLKDSSLTLVLESLNGQKTELFDPEQELDVSQKTIHIIPNPDGFEPISGTLALIIAIISVGIALLLAPKMEEITASASGANFETADNVVGQGGVIPVALGRRKHGSRVASHSFDSSLYMGVGV